jgi:hypothetical protein
MSVFGKAKFGSNKRTYFKLKDGETGPFRIFPPMGDLQDDGKWSVFYRIHYGYKNSKGELRMFQSPEVQNRKTRMIEVRDAAKDRITQLKTLLDEARKAGDEKKVIKLLELVGGKKSRFNLDSNHYLNVIDLQGNIGILKIRHRAKLALDATIKSLRDKGIEPIDPDTGRFFLFTRSGNAMETTYQVSVYKKKLHVDGVGDVEQDFVHTITPDIAKRCLTENEDGTFKYKEAGRLDRLFRMLTEEEVKRIVTEGEKAVDEIFDTKATVEDTGNDDDSGTEDDDTPTVTSTSGPTASANQQTAPNNTVTGNVDLEAAALLAAASAVASTQTKPTTVTTTPPVTAPAVTTNGAPKTTAQVVGEQSDEEFLRSLGY